MDVVDSYCRVGRSGCYRLVAVAKCKHALGQKPSRKDRRIGEGRKISPGLRSKHCRTEIPWPGRDN